MIDSATKPVRLTRQKRLGNTILYLVLTVLSAFGIYPIFFSLFSSLKSNDDILSAPYALPKSFFLENYVNAWEIGHIGRYFINTIFLTVCSIILTAFIGALASYGISRFNFKSKNLLYIFFTAGLMVPIQSTIIPLAYAFGKLKLNDNYLVMILLFAAFSIPMTIFILVGFMKSIPLELEEAAIIDGCTPLKVFFNIIVPMSIPAVASVSIFNFIATWNNLLFPLLFIRKTSLYTISIGLLSFFAERTSDFGSVMAGAMITMLPPMIIYILMQEKVEKGLTAGAVKG